AAVGEARQRVAVRQGLQRGIVAPERDAHAAQVALQPLADADLAHEDRPAARQQDHRRRAQHGGLQRGPLPSGEDLFRGQAAGDEQRKALQMPVAVQPLDIVDAGRLHDRADVAVALDPLPDAAVADVHADLVVAERAAEDQGAVVEREQDGALLPDVETLVEAPEPREVQRDQRDAREAAVGRFDAARQRQDPRAGRPAAHGHAHMRPAPGVQQVVLEILAVEIIALHGARQRRRQPLAVRPVHEQAVQFTDVVRELAQPSRQARRGGLAEAVVLDALDHLGQHGIAQLDRRLRMRRERARHVGRGDAAVFLDGL
ncbi:conserved hypothetical protein, partial [Ricinus communis]